MTTYNQRVQARLSELGLSDCLGLNLSKAVDLAVLSAICNYKTRGDWIRYNECRRSIRDINEELRKVAEVEKGIRLTMDEEEAMSSGNI